MQQSIGAPQRRKAPLKKDRPELREGEKKQEIPSVENVFWKCPRVIYNDTEKTNARALRAPPWFSHAGVRRERNDSLRARQGERGGDVF